MATDILITLTIKVFISSLASVGLIEFLKNFIRTSRTWIYSVIMPFVAVGCFFACEYLDIVVIGSVLTVGTVQLSYQTLVQGFKRFVDAKVSTISKGSAPAVPETENRNGAGITSPGATDYSAQ